MPMIEKLFPWSAVQKILIVFIICIGHVRYEVVIFMTGAQRAFGASGKCNKVVKMDDKMHECVPVKMKSSPQKMPKTGG